MNTTTRSSSREKFLSAFALIIGISGVVLCVLGFIGCLSLFHYIPLFNYTTSSTGLPILCGIGVILTFVMIISNVYLIVGVKFENTQAVRLWLIVNSCCLVLSLILLLFSGKSIHSEQHQNLFYLLAGVYFIGFMICLVVINLFLKFVRGTNSAIPINSSRVFDVSTVNLL